MNCKIFDRKSTILLSGFLTALVVTAFLSLSIAAYAEEITYTGNGENLQNIPAWFYDGQGIGLFSGSQKVPLSSDNKVTLNYAPETKGVQHPEFVCGGMSELDNVAGNKVILLNGRVDIDVIAGESRKGDVIGNKVSMSGGSVKNNIFSGYSLGGSTTNNNITITGGSVGNSIHSGYSEDGDATGNTVTISGGSVGDVYGGSSNDSSGTSNSVAVSGGTVNGNVYGGTSLDGDAKNNTTTISGGIINNNVLGGRSGEGDVAGNSVTISGGSVAGDVYGGVSDYGYVSGNTVTISGGIVSGGVLGGCSYHGSATGNIVTISGRPNLAKAHLWGGQTKTEQEDAFTDNTSNFKSSGISAQSIRNFEYYNFYLPENMTVSEVMLNVTKSVDLKGTTVDIFLQGNAKLREGDKIALIHSAGGVSNAPKNKSCKAKQVGTLYEFSLYTDSNNLWAKVEKVGNTAK